MTTKISTDNIQTSTLESIGGPTITNIQITNSSYVVLDDTAVGTSGGYIKITGKRFATGCTVIINGTSATSVTFINSTTIHAQVGPQTAGTYIVYVTNTDGSTAIRVNGITYSGTPTWVTGSTLSSGATDASISIQLSATSDSNITYTLQAGSSLPPGLTLSSGGLLSGTVTGLSTETIYNFTIVATDIEYQDSPRAFSITITVGDPYFNSTTLLLPGNATTFVRDASTNNFAVTVVGDTRPNTFNPYLTGWSNYFDGTGDYLSSITSTSTAFGTGDYTIESWIYRSDTGVQRAIVDTRGVDATGVLFYITASEKLTLFDSTTVYLTGSSNVPANQWVHVAVTRSSGTTRLFINGIVDATLANDTRNNSTGAGGCFIGRQFGSTVNDFLGYISNTRIVKGTAVYTANFTPPTSPLTAIANTSLLTCADNRFIDDSTNNFTITRNGDVKIQSFSPFVEPTTTRGSAYFDGSGDYMSTSGTPINFGTGDFTIEWWVYRVTAITSDRDELPMSGVSGTSFMLGMQNGTLNFGINTTSWNITSSIVIPLNVWAHCAITRVGSTVTMYINGAVAGSATMSTNFTGATAFDIGRRQGAVTNLIQVYCSNLRVVNGTAVYTAAFTPPSQPLTAVTGTSLLTLQNNQPNNNSMFLDSSSSNFLVTRAGNTTQGTFSPYSPSGWSNYFDGTGDYLSAPANAAFNFGSANLTVECWVYVSSTPSNMPIIAWATGANKNLRLNSSSLNFEANDPSGVSLTVAFPSSVSLNAWNHIALVRSGNSLFAYLNGVSGSATSYTGNWGNSTDALNIGYKSDPAYFNGYLSNLRLVKGTAVYTANFTPSTQPLTAIAGTSLLTCADNRFIDESANNFAITRNGDTRITNFSPFKAQVQTPVTYSAYFDGTNSSLSVPANTAFQLTGDFTVEAWIYPTALSGTANMIIGSAAGSATDWFGLVPTQLQIVISNAATNWNYAFSTNTWYHVAVARSGTNLTAYVNGVSLGAQTRSEQFLNTGFGVMVGRYGFSGAFWFTGYISNARIVKGTAVYTANFTPSTTPLTAITNTSLLTCQSATFVDNSTNRFAITAAGNSRPTQVNPFGFTFVNSQGYTAAEYGGSMYFDGTGDYLTSPASSNFSFPGDFTIEGWMYFTNTAGASPQALFSVRSGTTEFDIRWFTTRWQVSLNAGTGTDIGSTPAPANNAWTHVACVRSGTSINLYINGVSTGTTLTNSSILGQTAQPATIAASNTGGNIFTGYIANVRVIRGQALYTSNFVPPIAPVLPVANTTLLLNGTSAAITDATTKNDLETVGDTKISTAVSKFGGSSMYFDGTGDYLSIADNPLIELVSNNFTIEGWFYWVANTGNWTLFYKASSYELKSDSNRWVWQVNAASNVFITSWTPTLSTWYHIALVRNGTTTTLYVNGINYTSGTSVNANDNANPLLIGSNPSVAAFNGYVQDFRITNGIARYTANFTPPTSAFTNK